MTLYRLFPAALFVLALAGCSTTSAVVSPIPSDREVVAYVTSNWSDYDAQFALLSQRQGQTAAIVSVTDVECVADDGDARCTFIVQGRFEDGVVLRQPMESYFQRQGDGSIEELIPVLPA